MYKKLFSVWVLAALPVLASAQTVTVSKSGPATYTTLADALASFNPDPNAGAPNVVQVTDSSVYDEVVNINVPVTLEATGATKATIALQSNVAGLGANSGLVINLPHPEFTTGTVVIRNFNIIPSLSTSGNRLTAAIEQVNANLFLMLDKLIVCPNDGNNQPLVTDAVTNRVNEINYVNGTNPAYNPNIVLFNDDGVIAGRAGDPFLEGDGVELLIRDTVISTFRADLQQVKGSTNGDLVVFGGGTWPNSLFRQITVEGHGGFSYGRIGLYMFGQVKVHGDPNDRMHIRGHSLAGIYLDWSTASTTAKDIENVIIDGASQYGIYDNGRGDVRYSLRNSILYYFGRGCLFTKKQTVAVGGDNIFENCTMVDGRQGAFHSFRWEGGNTMNIIMRNCILGGKYNYDANSTQSAANKGLNTVWFSTGTGATAHISSTAVITTGPFSLRSSGPLASEPTTSESLIFTDARFLSNGHLLVKDGVPYDDPSATPGIYDPSASDFMNVTNPDYELAGDLDPSDGVTSVPLGGGATYVGPPSGVNDWDLYAVGSQDYEKSLNSVIMMHDRKMRQ